MSQISEYVDLAIMQHNCANDSKNECVDYSKDVKLPNTEYVQFGDMRDQKRVGLPIYADNNGYGIFNMSHSFIFGSTGTGKSTVFFENAIRYFSDLPESVRPSMLITDLKGEIYPLFAARLKRLGYNVAVFDMTNPYHSSTYNLLSQIYDDFTEAMNIRDRIRKNEIKFSFDGVRYHSKAEALCAAENKARDLLDKSEKRIVEISEIIIQCDDRRNLSWFEGARNCFVSVVLAILADSRRKNTRVTKENFTITSVVSTILTPGDDDYRSLSSWLTSCAELEGIDPIIADHIRLANSIYQAKAHVTRDSYLSTLTQQLKSFLSLSVQALTATSDELCPRKIASEPDKATAVFVLTNDSNVVTNALSTIFINELAEELTFSADSRPDRKLPRPFIFLLDEFANMPEFKGISGLVTTGRSRNIWVQMAIQSIEQITEKYGGETERILWDNTGKIFLGINSVDTKKRFAEEMGTKKRNEYSAHVDSEGLVSYNISTREEPSVSINDLDSLKLGEFYVNYFRCPKLRSSMIPYFWRDDVEPEKTVWMPSRPAKTNYNDIYNGVREYERRDDEDDEDDDDTPDISRFSFSDYLETVRKRSDKKDDL